MLTEIIPGEYYFREDGVKVLAKDPMIDRDSRAYERCLVVCESTDPEKPDDYYRWRSDFRDPNCPKAWDGVAKPGVLVVGSDWRQGFALVRRVGDRLSENQLELF